MLNKKMHANIILQPVGVNKIKGVQKH